MERPHIAPSGADVCDVYWRNPPQSDLAAALLVAPERAHVYRRWHELRCNYDLISRRASIIHSRFDS
jgi:hypothetical protein